MSTAPPTSNPLRVAGLFAGIGGIEVGLHAAGHSTALLCEVDPAAQAVLSHRFPDVPLVSDIRKLEMLPAVDLVAAGFPCQDLSQAGRTAGITGARSRLVDHVFRLLESSGGAHWLLLENVPFMLRLDRGHAMSHLTNILSSLGYRWAYRVVDTRSFGLPQRRQRVILLASRDDDPRTVLFADEVGDPGPIAPAGRACGFYWTEGTRGLGWAVDAVPTLKTGSSVGIPSPPAIWMPNGGIVTPEIRDAERLQGFAADWTLAAQGNAVGRGARWKLVGNAVSVPVAEWVGHRLQARGEYCAADDKELRPGSTWPTAAWGETGRAYESDRSEWPVRATYQHLDAFLEYEAAALSERATRGFLARARATTSLRFPDGFLDAVAKHLASMEAKSMAA